MKESNRKLLDAIIQDEGVAAAAEQLGRECERRATEQFGGARDSLTSQYRRAWQKAGLSLATTAALLRRDV